MPTATSKRINFLNTLSSAPTACEITKLCHDYKKQHGFSYDAYHILTHTSTSNLQSHLTRADLLDFYKKVYDMWFYYLQKTDNSLFEGKNKDAVITIKTSPRFLPQNMPPEKCEEFIFGGYDKEFPETRVMPMNAQGLNNPCRGNQIDFDFLHIHPFTGVGEINCRLYLNLLPENAIKIGTMILENSLQNNRKTYFKFSTTNHRNDTFLIYTNYEQAQEYVNLLKQIKAAHPQLFVGCENISPFMPNIDGFIGFGEEPQYAHSSFNYERARAVDEFFKDRAAEQLQAIGNFTGTIDTSEGTSLGLEDYLKYRITKSLKDTLLQTQKDIAQNKIPERYKTPKRLNAYIAIEQEIFNSCKTSLPKEVQQQLDQSVAHIMNMLKKGKMVFAPVFRFSTANPELSIYSDDYKKRMLAQGKLFSYDLKINLNLVEKLFDVFGALDNIEQQITPENVAPYFEKHHIDPHLTFLNTETIADLKTARGKEK